MGDLQDAFVKLLDRQPSDREIQDLYRIKDALGLSNNDALWQILIVLQHYENKYELIPERIEAAAIGTLNSFRAAADSSTRLLMASATADLSMSVQQVASSIANDISKKDKLRWASLAAIFLTGCCLFLGCSSFYLGSEYGWKDGYSEGYSQIKNENLMAAWGNSADGQLAYRLSLITDIKKLAKCQGVGWILKNKLCVPRDQNGIMNGWLVP